MFVYGIIIGIVLFLGISSILPTLAINQNTSFSNEDKSAVVPVKEADNKLILISNVIENRLEKAVAILEFTSRLPEMREPLLLGLFNSASKGIPENADLDRRQIAQEILSKYPEEFVSLLFLMPNGTVYLLEPFTRQQNLSTYDLSFREYYKAATESNDILLGNLIKSLSTGRNQVQLTLPVFSMDDGNQTISRIGVLSGGLNLKTYNEILQSLNLSNQERIVLLDSNGTKIADSDAEQQSLLKSTYGDVLFKNLQSFNNAVKGETGTVQEMVNGSNTEIKYKPVKAIQKNWVLLLFRSPGVSDISTYSNSSQTGNTTANILSDDTMLNSSIINKSKSSSLSTTMPKQLPPHTNTSTTGNSIPFLNKSSIPFLNKSSITILSHNSYVDSVGYFHVVGKVENSTPSTAEFVQITGTFYDINNAVVGNQFTYTNPPDISPGATAPFNLILMSASVPTSLIDHYKLSVSYK